MTLSSFVTWSEDGTRALRRTKKNGSFFSQHGTRHHNRRTMKTPLWAVMVLKCLPPTCITLCGKLSSKVHFECSVENRQTYRKRVVSMFVPDDRLPLYFNWAQHLPALNDIDEELIQITFLFFIYTFNLFIFVSRR